MGLLVATPAAAATIHGLVYIDQNGDGLPSPGEPGVANARVALDVESFATTDARGQFELPVVKGTPGIVWVRVPDGFAPGPVRPTWARDARKKNVLWQRARTHGWWTSCGEANSTPSRRNEP